ncbi:3'(2'),5'-bisphosphate nucleotidase CysQ [Mesorhizobium sp. NBSH29]|nr:3'(2'),5'-bisphosphate nucleotidase CysQ [Mesorhizobium sp. NBSH29]
MGYFRQDPQVWMKTGQSPVSEADYAVDTYLRETLLKARPDYGWLSEETVDSPERLSRRRTFVVDPIDGTRAFLEGYPVWCVSIAVVEDGISRAGVLDCPAKGEIYWAAADGGAFRNGQPLKVNPHREAFTVAGPKPMLAATPPKWKDRFTVIPYIPSLACRVAMVASGELDASYVKANAHDWDLAAADLILREAGGKLVDAAGAELRYAGTHPVHGALVAGSGPLLQVMTSVIAGLDA